MEISVKGIMIIFFAVVMIVIGTWFFSTLGPNLSGIQKGELIPFEVDNQKDFDIQMGGCHYIVTFDNLSSGVDFQRAYYFEGIDYPFDVSYKDGRLLVSAEIRNKEGEVVAKIGDNHWSVNPNPIIAYDRNFNAYAFEAIDSDNVPVLQVVMTPGNTIFVGGVFYGENTTLIAMINGTTIFNPVDYKYDQRIFQYSSDINLGKLVANSPYAFGIQLPLSPNDIIAIGYILLGIGTFVPLVVGVNSFRKKKKLKNKTRRKNYKRKKGIVDNNKKTNEKEWEKKKKERKNSGSLRS